MAKITEEEFITYYDSYSRALFQHCYLRVYDWEYAKDLVQDIYLRAWNHLQQGNEVIYMRAFLYRIANNLIIDGARRRKRRGGRATASTPPRGGCRNARPPAMLAMILSAGCRRRWTECPGMWRKTSSGLKAPISLRIWRESSTAQRKTSGVFNGLILRRNPSKSSLAS